jgi:hypothetical protein
MMYSRHIRIKYIKFYTSLGDKTYYKKSIKLNIYFVSTYQNTDLKLLPQAFPLTN